MAEQESKLVEAGQLEKLEKKEGREMGKNVLLILKIMRHGERTKGGELTDYGRLITKEKAEGVALPELSRAKAVGSPFKPKESKAPPRSLETADIYAEQLLQSGKVEKKYATRARALLSPEGMKTPEPFDWTAVYNSQLPPNFEELPDEEKAEAAHQAQTVAVEKMLITENAAEYRREIARNHAVFVDRYIKMVQRLKEGEKILYVTGSHGGIMEPFLQECLIRKDKNGQEKRGFQHLEEIGGAIRPSEAFNIIIKTDERGEKNVAVSFDDPNRLPGEELTLDLAKLEELKNEYLEKHREEKT